MLKNVRWYSCKYLLLLSDFNEIFSTDLEKNSNIKYHENLSCGSGVVPQGRMGRRKDGRAGGRAEGRMDGQTDMKLTFVFRNFANAHKKKQFLLMI